MALSFSILFYLVTLPGHRLADEFAKEAVSGVLQEVSSIVDGFTQDIVRNEFGLPPAVEEDRKRDVPVGDTQPPAVGAHGFFNPSLAQVPGNPLDVSIPSFNDELPPFSWERAAADNKQQATPPLQPQQQPREDHSTEVNITSQQDTQTATVSASEPSIDALGGTTAAATTSADDKQQASQDEVKDDDEDDYSDDFGADEVDD